MKKVITLTMILLTAAWITACSGYTLEETEDVSETSQCNLSLQVKSRAEGGITYPLSVYLFDSENSLVCSQEVTDADTVFQQVLKKGKYTLTAFSAPDRKAYIFPQRITAESLIQLASPYYAESSLIHGNSTINLDNDTKVTVYLENAMSSIYFRFSNIPDDATKVEVTVSPISSGISLTGSYSIDNTNCMIPCEKAEGLWEAGPYFIFPSQNSKTYFSINISRAGESKTYSYTYNQPLEPNRPYQFTAEYNEENGFILSGEFETTDWKPVIDVEFGIGGETDSGNTSTGGEPGSDTFYVNQLPTADTIWGGFYVWKTIQISETEIEAILISPEQWILKASEALATLADYAPDDISGWRTFTTEEAKEFRNQFYDTLESLNEFLTDNGLIAFYRYSGERYLCNEAKSTFSLSNNTIRDAGATVKYYLRGVKTVRIRKK
ncbi:FimB/Mfa2 family fimbrial subunit [uncultured Bacteroides sp.]|uniref:FimB/Mfa2 family fimbrial subunit n=1 Tax=uncultured Bacteroides sp. TaxID=162156 RepID=UPI002614065A|nr:FimB/Mfa2 family fimbrial subunit [uncultured Bacteroides sp.]